MAQYFSGGSVGGGGSVPAWTEDSNSPHTASDASSTTFSLAGEYDRVLAKYQYIVGSEAARDQLFLVVNGITSGDYDWLESDGSGGAASDAVVLGNGQNDWGYAGDLEIDGSWANSQGIVGQSTLTPVDMLTCTYRFAEQTASTPLESWSLSFASGTISLRGRVYGLNI